MDLNKLDNDTDPTPLRTTPRTGPIGPCWPCQLGDHGRCFAAECWTCPRTNHPHLVEGDPWPQQVTS